MRPSWRPRRLVPDLAADLLVHVRIRRKKLLLLGLQTQGDAHPCKASTVHRYRPQGLQSLAVVGRGVALVDGETVARVLRIQGLHQGVPGGLGDDRGGSDAAGKRIPVDDSTLRTRTSPDSPGIHENEIH